MTSPLPLATGADTTLDNLVVLPYTARVLAEAQAMATLRSSPQISSDHIIEAARKVRKGYVRNGIFGDGIMAVGWLLIGYFGNLISTFLTLPNEDRGNVETSAIALSLVTLFVGILLVVGGALIRSRMSE